MYCGNNRLDPAVVRDGQRLGTRYECFRKGVGVGSRMPEPEERDYEPIDARRVYCGKSRRLPPGYAYMGNLAQCLQKGVGVGLYRRR